MDDFLTAWVLHDAKLMTYRLLSRERGIHVQDAKTALQGFYERTVKKKTLALSALYVVKGILKEESAGIPSYHLEGTSAESKEEDTPMREQDDDAGPGPSQSASQLQQTKADSSLSRYAKSAPPIAAPELVPRKQLLLVSADKLEETKARFDTITTSHIYSLAPGPDPDSTTAKADGQGALSLAQAALKQIPLLATIQNELHARKDYVIAWERAQRGRDLGVIWNASIVEDFSPNFVPAQAAAPAAPAKAGLSEKKSAAKAQPVKTEKADSKATSSKSAFQITNRKSEPPKPVAPTAVAEAAAVAPVAERVDAGPSKKQKPAEEPTPPPVRSETKPVKAGYKVTNSKYKVTGSAKRQREEDEADEDETPKPPLAPAAQRQQHRADAAAAPEPPKAAADNRSSSGPAAVPAPPPKPKTGFGSGAGSGSGFGKSGSGSGGGAAKKPVDKRQQTLGSFFKKKT
ncbi:CDC27 protein [Tilletia horrida]|nr:CDC27 protein [Tilletia horrida]